MGIFDKLLRTGEGKKVKALAGLIPDIGALEPEMQALSDDALQAKTSECKQRIDNGEDLDEVLSEAYAGLREAGGLAGQLLYDHIYERSWALLSDFARQVLRWFTNFPTS